MYICEDDFIKCNNLGMNKFFSSCLGSCLGVFAAMTIGLVVVISMLVSSIASLIEDTESPVVSDSSVLYIDLKGVINEYDAGDDLFSNISNPDLELTGNTVSNITRAINTAIEDDNIAGIFVECNGGELGVAASTEIRDMLQTFKSATGKWVYAYGGEISQDNYYVASAADSLFVNPVGSVDIHGLASVSLYYKRLLDNLGVDIQVLKSGKYKSAVEPYTSNDMSSEDRVQREGYVNSIWGAIVSDISASRGISESELRILAADMMVAKGSDYLLENGIVDGVCYRADVINKIMELVGVDEQDDLNVISAKNLTMAIDELSDMDGDEIAVLYAVGEINSYGVDGINYRKLVKEIDELAADDDVKAMVLRVNSPGGSAYDAEQIWEALERFKLSGKPLVVSMGDLAASGGYYIACGGDCIFAEPTTLTGSIGVFGIIPSVKRLLKDGIGINSAVVATNQNADMMSMFEPMTEQQMAAMQGSVTRIYDTFVKRVADGRDMSVEDVDSIAQGRVWSGSMAKEIGLVDSLGGLTKAINAAAILADVDDYEVVMYPELDSDWDYLMSLFTDMDMTRLFAPDLELIDYKRKVDGLLKQDPIQMIYFESEIK